MAPIKHARKAEGNITLKNITTDPKYRYSENQTCLTNPKKAGKDKNKNTRIRHSREANKNPNKTFLASIKRKPAKKLTQNSKK
jgi:hypothetical protein